jgi:hypothetical protein
VCQDFFAVCDDWDAHCNILEPPLPAARASTFRRIALGGHGTLLLPIDPRAPRTRPRDEGAAAGSTSGGGLRLAGAEAVTQPLEAAWRARQHLWYAMRKVDYLCN